MSITVKHDNNKTTIDTNTHAYYIMCTRITQPGCTEVKHNYTLQVMQLLKCRYIFSDTIKIHLTILIGMVNIQPVCCVVF